MCRYRIFKVDDDTWNEHITVGIAAINDPYNHNNPQCMAQRQSAIAEISGIRPGDILFFNRMRSDNHPPQILGIYKATSTPYYDPNPLFPNAQYINQDYPFRIKFECLHNFPNPINFSEIWSLRDKGKIWTLQQSRGDAVGKHACVGITKIEAKLIERLLRSNNIIENPVINFQQVQIQQNPLPLNYDNDNNGTLHYEAVLKALLLENFANGLYKDIFGDYDDFIPNVLLGSGKEIDILLLKYDGDDIIWYQIIELKQDKFTMDELKKLIIYEKEIIRNQADNPLQVYPIAIARKFNEDVINYVNGRLNYMDRPIKLISYYFNNNDNSITLNVI